MLTVQRLTIWMASLSVLVIMLCGVIAMQYMKVAALTNTVESNAKTLERAVEKIDELHDLGEIHNDRDVETVFRLSSENLTFVSESLYSAEFSLPASLGSMVTAVEVDFSRSQLRDQLVQELYFAVEETMGTVVVSVHVPNHKTRDFDQRVRNDDIDIELNARLLLRA